VQDDQPTSFRNVASKGMAFTALGQGLKLFVHVTAIVTLSRLLGPSDFGIFAMLSPILALATLLRDGGISGAILQRQTMSHAELSALFWISVCWGLGLAALLALSAPYIAAFYGEPRLVSLVVASAVIVIAGSLSLQHLALLNRELRFRVLAAIDAGSLAAGYFVGIVMAAITRSYWALWAVNCTTAISMLIASWIACHWRPGRPDRQGGVGDILRVGGNITVSGLFDFLVRSLDKVLIGRSRGDFELGLYDRAYRIVLLPLVFVITPLDRLVLPSLVRMRDDAESYRKVYRLALQAPLLAIIPPMATIMAAPEPVCVFLLGREWASAAPLLAWLSLAAALQLIASSLGSLLISQGRTRDLTALNACSFVFAALAYFIGLRSGALGVAAAYAISEAIRSPVALWWATRKGPVRLKDVGEAVLPFFMSAACVFAVVTFMERPLSSEPALLLGLSIPVSYTIAILAMVLTAAGRQCLHEAVKVAAELRTSLNWPKHSRSVAGRSIGRR
jgi:PST family polysaccharide transporter